MAIDFNQPANEADVYPAIHHFRVIADGAADDVEASLVALLAAYELTAPLTRGRQSSGGKYQVFQLSVRFPGRVEHLAFHAAVKAVPGVRILL